MAVRGQAGSRFELPLDYEERFAAIAHPKADRWLQFPEARDLCTRNVTRARSHYHRSNPVEIGLLAGSRRILMELLGNGHTLFKKSLPIKLPIGARPERIHRFLLAELTRKHYSCTLEHDRRRNRCRKVEHATTSFRKARRGVS